MIVKPVPTGSQALRRRTRLVVLLPVAMLLGVVALAVVGNAAKPAVPQSVAVIPAPTAAASSVASSNPGTARPALFPASMDGVVVESVDEALAGADEAPPDAVIAVAGYIGVPTPLEACAGSALAMLICDRSTLLVGAPWSLGGSEAMASLGPHLHVRVPRQLPVPATLGDRVAALGAPVRAVVIGRFGPFLLDGCTEITAACEREFELEAIPWADGSVSSLSPIARNGRLAAGVALGPAGVILRASLMRGANVRQVDVTAAASLGPDALPAQVWYVRGIRGAPAHGTGSAALVWAVVDDATLEVLARGEVGPVLQPSGR